MASPVWKVLDLDSQAATPLLVKSRHDLSGYDVLVTDLSSIWSESLAKDDIVRRAFENDCGIDPGEDEEQLEIFHRKIESALDRNDGTSIDIRSEDDGERLELVVSSPLPKPLKPFEWSMRLHRLPNESLKSELVVPLVSQTRVLQKQIHSLITELHDKDRVISRITDRLETSGNDLTTVFPGVANIKTSRKKSQREQLAKHVKGLGDFQEESWKERVTRFDESETSLRERMNDVLKYLPQPMPTLSNTSTRRPERESDPQSKPGLHADNFDPQNSTTKYGKRAAKSDEDEDLPDSGFQRQDTPPNLRRQRCFNAFPEESGRDAQADMSGATARSEVEDESTTEDEDDLDAPAAGKRTETALSAARPSQSFADQTIIGRSSREKSSADTCNPAGTNDLGSAMQGNKLGTFGGRAGKIEQSQSERPTEPFSLAIKPQVKLGVIGGKSKRSASPEVSKEVDSHASENAVEPGAIRGPEPSGERSGAHIVNTVEPAEQHLPQKSRGLGNHEPPSRLEDFQERANWRRSQLQRELQEKARAPVKKKRKF